MNTFDAAGVILIVFAGFELMRWFDTHRKQRSLEAPQQGYQHDDQWRDVHKTAEVGATPNVLETLWED
jgi:hypothetical protein